MKVHINNEYDRLKKVIVASANYYDPTSLAINNETIKYYAKQGDIPTKEAIIREQEMFWDILKKRNIELLIAEEVDNAKGQMFTRDLAFAIKDKLFISNMKKENRKKAIDGWKSIIAEIDKDKIIKVPKDIYLEGGDVLVDNKTVYVGISERTNMDGVNFLRKTLDKSYTIIPLKLKPKFLHLDVVLTIINPNMILVYKEGLDETSYKSLEDYDKIELTKQEQFELGTNVFVIDPKTVIINSNHKRIKEELEKRKLNVIPTNISETAKDGGAFRCITCPIERI